MASRKREPEPFPGHAERERLNTERARIWSKILEVEADIKLADLAGENIKGMIRQHNALKQQHDELTAVVVRWYIAEAHNLADRVDDWLRRYAPTYRTDPWALVQRGAQFQPQLDAELYWETTGYLRAERLHDKALNTKLRPESWSVLVAEFDAELEAMTEAWRPHRKNLRERTHEDDFGPRGAGSVGEVFVTPPSKSPVKAPAGPVA